MQDFVEEKRKALLELEEALKELLQIDALTLREKALVLEAIEKVGEGDYEPTQRS